MMPTHKRITAVFGSMLLVAALAAGVGAQTSAPDSTKEAAPQQSQESQPAQSSQPNQPSAPAQGAPAQDTKSSESRTDYRSDTKSERVVETERTRFLGMDPSLAMIVGAVLFVVIVLAVVAMSRKPATTTVETRRTL